ncbi:hypothetical protein KIPB_007910 [Kipferlia bialata]|uniref:Uncharacterized protein n=1 Tax=Kipferlia bialata TaxID=797122 RepID=A0A9K3D0S4_9EUKA|nr:hypothetical protein KIPB_007910 [Kipferlia bialata]|eukprot:g7910.t1
MDLYGYLDPLDAYSPWVSKVALFNSCVGGAVSFAMCLGSVLVLRFLLPHRLADDMWPNRLVLWLGINDMIHSLEPFFIFTRTQAYKIPCYLQFFGGQACHLGSMAFATFIAIEIYRGVILCQRTTPK